MIARSLLGAVPLVVLAGTAALAEATAAGADRLTALFQSYLGTTPGVVAVAPAGDVYELTVDLAPLAAMIPQAGAQGVKITASPLTYMLEEQGGGLWRVTENQPFTMTAVAPGALDLSISYDSIVSDGIWDESLQSFTSWTADVGGLQSTSKSFGPDGTEIGEGGTSIANARYELTGTAGDAGGVDSDLDFTATGYTQTMNFAMAPGASPMSVALTAETYGATGTAEGLRSGGMLNLLAFFVRTASPEAIAGSQDELKLLMGEGIPLFENMDVTASLGGLQATTPIGPISAEAMEVDVGLGGIVAEGRFREAIRLSGLSIPAGLVPEWAAPLIPADATVDVEVTDFNLSTPARTLIGALDLTQPQPVDPALNAQLLGELLPSGAVTITFAPGSVVNEAYTLGFEGAMSVGPAAPPTGSGRITATGIERVQEILGAAPPEVGAQALGMLGLAMGLSRPGEGDGVVWEIDASTPGQVLVNGTDMSAMFGMQ